jgi:hypothetical protein
MRSHIQRIIRRMRVLRESGYFRLMPRQRWVWKQRFAIGWFLFEFKMRRTLRLILARCGSSAEDTCALQSRNRD